MAVRITFTNYDFKRPTTPLTEAQYETLRHLSDPQFKEQLKLAKKEAGREFRAEYMADLKFLAISTVSGIAMILFLDLFRKYDTHGILETISVIIMIILMLAWFGNLGGLSLSSSTNSKSIKDFANFLKERRQDVLMSQDYAGYLATHRIKLNKHGK